MCSLVLCFTCISPLSASATETGSTEPMPKFTVVGDGIRLISVEYIPDDCEDSSIPDEVMEKLTCDSVQNDVVPYGTSIPSGSSTYDLSSRKYSFGIETDSLYYSDYVFTGHGGSVTMNLKNATLEFVCLHADKQLALPHQRQIPCAGGAFLPAHSCDFDDLYPSHRR